MMLGRASRKARPVVRGKSGEDAALWRIFDPEFEGKVEVLACVEGEEGFNLTIRDNFRIADHDAMQAPLPQSKGTVDNFSTCFVKKMALLICSLDGLHAGDLGALGDPDANGVPKKQVEKTVWFRQTKKHETIVVPPLVPQVAGISHTSFRRYTDYVVVFDTLEGLGVPGGGAAAGGSSAVSKPAGEEKKRKVEEKAAGAGEKKRTRLQMKRTTAVSQPKLAAVAGK
ncbi:hypothetical protein Hdeb2414_s0006g00224571 [Helianthus debilis subsp. tardiflorus]